MKMRTFLICAILFLLVSITGFSQPGGGGNPGAGDPAPITGIELILAAGSIFGFKRILSKRKEG